MSSLFLLLIFLFPVAEPHAERRKYRVFQDSRRTGHAHAIAFPV